jgi:hypothetical protein
VLCAVVLAAGSVRAAERGIYRVDDFGAVHDGDTDDGPAILAAIEECSRTGGIVQFGPGVYVFRDSLEITASSVILRGVGRANPRHFDGAERGTVLFHKPPRGAASPTAVRIGHQPERVVACGIEDLTIRASTGNTGHLLWMAGVEYCHLDRVDLFHNAADAPGKAALHVTSLVAKAPSTGCRFESVHVFTARNKGGEGIGILIASDGPSWTTDLSFLHVKVNNARPPGRSLWIRGSTEGRNASHSFVSCRVDAAGSAGVLVEAPRCRFVSCVIDGPGGDAEMLTFTERARGGSWNGPVDGKIVNALAGSPASPRIDE